MTSEALAFLMFAAIIPVLLLGYPVALTLGGGALLFALAGDAMGLINTGVLSVFPLRIFGLMRNEALVAVPLFVFMGLVLEKSGITTRLLETMGKLFGRLHGGLGISVLFIGTLMAASTGIVGATVVTMGLMSLPAMLRAGYDRRLAAGLICSSGTLGQIIPPSIVLILLADVLQGANEHAAFLKGSLVPEPVTAIDLFAGAIFPGLMLVGLYMLWQVFQALFRPASCPPLVDEDGERASLAACLRAILPPLCLIFLVLGSILAGVATATESAAIGGVGAILLSLREKGALSLENIRTITQTTTRITAMIFLILIGANMFSLVFRALGGDAIVEEFLGNLPGGRFTAMLLVMVVVFFLGFFLDFLEIIFVIVPIVGPVLISMGYDPLWVGIMLAVNLQTSFLTPPFGFSLFYLRGVAPPELKTRDIYMGVIPFIVLQAVGIALIWTFPGIVSWLPDRLFGPS